MQIELFSDKYKVHTLTNKNIDEIYNLQSQNVLFYEYCPPFVTRQAIQEDMRILPPGKVIEDKYYIGFYQEGKLIAVMDLIDGYPEKRIVCYDNKILPMGHRVYVRSAGRMIA